jgi:hypothetical protein
MSGAPAAETVEIRPYRPGDEAAIEEGFRRVFGVERPAGEWAWKFPPAEEEGGRRVMLALAGGEVVAHAAAQPVRFTVDGRAVLAGHVVDAFSRPRAGLARRGVFARTVDALFATWCGAGGIAFVYGFPGARHMLLGRRLLGYAEPRPVPYRVKALGARLEDGGATREAWRRLRRRLSGLRVEAGLAAPAVDELWRRAAGRYPVAAVRDGRHAAARFAGRPGVDYLHLTVRRRGRPVAWAAARLEGDLLRWADLVWDGASPADLAALEASLAARAVAAGAVRGELWLGGDPAATALLAERGWLAAPHPQGLEMSAVAFVPTLDAADLARRAYLTLADSDLV